MYENEVTLYTDIFKLYQLYVYSPYRKYYPNRSLQIEIAPMPYKRNLRTSPNRPISPL